MPSTANDPDLRLTRARHPHEMTTELTAQLIDCWMKTAIATKS